jgi:hypothetical protein
MAERYKRSDEVAASDGDLWRRCCFQRFWLAAASLGGDDMEEGVTAPWRSGRIELVVLSLASVNMVWRWRRQAGWVKYGS